jgi:hypothetical protein
LTQVFDVGETVSAWMLSPWVALVGAAVFVVVAATRADGERFRPLRLERAAMIALAVVGYLAMISGWLVECAAPELTLTNPPHARLLLPLLPAAAIAAAPAGRVAARLARFTVPLAGLLVACDVLFVISVGVARP